MRERKKIRIEHESKDIIEILKKLTSMPQSQEFTKDTQEMLSSLLHMLFHSASVDLVVQSITELFRITAPRSILKNNELITYFETILNLFPRVKLNLDTFIRFKIPALLNNKVLINQFFDLYGKSILNQAYLEDILVIFIEESVDPASYIQKVLCFSPLPKYILKKIHRLINIVDLLEEQYIRLYTEVLHDVDDHEIRIVRGKGRIQFIKLAIVTHKNEIQLAYADDRDKRVRLIIAGHCDIPEIFHRLLNDPDEDVRKHLIDRLHWADVSKYNIFDRALDKCYEVRQIIYRIYWEGVAALQQSDMFDKDGFISKCTLKNNKKLGCRNGVLPFIKNDVYLPDGIKLSDQENKMNELIYKFCDGCLTNNKDEYLDVLRESEFSLEFLYSLKEILGASVFLHSLEISDFNYFPEEYKDFCLEYFYKGKLSHREIMGCLNTDCFAVLNFIEMPAKYYKILVQKAIAVKDCRIVEKIVEKIKPILNSEEMIVLDETGQMIRRIENEHDNVDRSGTRAGVDEDSTKCFDLNKRDMTLTVESSYISILHQISGNDTQPSVADDLVISGRNLKNIPEVSFLGSMSDNLLILNAHTKCIRSEIEALYKGDGFGCGFYQLYFLVYQARNDPRTRERILAAELGADDLVSLLLYLNDPEFLPVVSHYLLGCNLSYNVQCRIRSARSLNASLIYFMSCGLVNVKSPVFFIKCLKVAIHSTDKSKTFKKEILKNIFRKYMHSVDQATYNVFYSICWALKDYAVDKPIDHSSVKEKNINPTEHSTEHSTIHPSEHSTVHPSNKKIQTKENLINKISENTPQKENKLKLRLADKVLYFICNFVIGMRSGTLIDKELNLSKYGFFKLDENSIEMARYDQVTYL